MSSEADRIIGLYQRHARVWADNRSVEAAEAPWLDRFLELLPNPASILDIGCGAAEPIARHFLLRGHTVTGVDSSAPLIEIARQRYPASRWLVSDMRALALGETFDGLIAWDSFFHLTPEHQRLMFPLFRAHAAPKAALMFTSGPAYGEAIGTFEGEPLYHASLDPAEYRTLLAANGFDVVAQVVEDPDCGGHTIWLAQAR
ncbi:MAG TPA: class I SAM-dependent methyltransferase [Reyranella sp.]|nr:class I SAM-dependent methyltransferase [Reyranella sp.]